MNGCFYSYRETLAKHIAYTIPYALAPGLLESVYHKYFCYELSKRNIPFIQQRKVPIKYDDIKLPEGLRWGILIDNLIIAELKAQEN